MSAASRRAGALLGRALLALVEVATALLLVVGGARLIGAATLIPAPAARAEAHAGRLAAANPAPDRERLRELLQAAFADADRP